MTNLRITPREYVKFFNVSNKTARIDLKNLEKKRFVVFIGSKKQVIMDLKVKTAKNLGITQVHQYFSFLINNQKCIKFKTMIKLPEFLHINREEWQKTSKKIMQNNALVYDGFIFKKTDKF